MVHRRTALSRLRVRDGKPRGFSTALRRLYYARALGVILNIVLIVGALSALALVWLLIQVIGNSGYHQ